MSRRLNLGFGLHAELCCQNHVVRVPTDQSKNWTVIFGVILNPSHNALMIGLY